MSNVNVGMMICVYVVVLDGTWCDVDDIEYKCYDLDTIPSVISTIVHMMDGLGSTEWTSTSTRCTGEREELPHCILSGECVFAVCRLFFGSRDWIFVLFSFSFLWLPFYRFSPHPNTPLSVPCDWVASLASAKRLKISSLITQLPKISSLQFLLSVHYCPESHLMKEAKVIEQTRDNLSTSTWRYFISLHCICLLH